MPTHHPFRVSRRQGSPNGLGQMMTLGAHIGSSNAHPGYLRKGEQVGSFDIGSHINDSSAHAWYYLRRAELATTLEQFNQSIDPTQFSGDNPNISASYPVIVTTNLLKQVLASTSGVQLKSSIDESYIDSAYIIGATAGKLGDVSNVVDVPAWGLFATLWNLVETFSYTSASGKNPLFVNNLVAPFYHTHSLDQVGPNGAADATHNHDSVYAKLAHNHDEEYYKRGETLTGAVAESTLQSYGLLYTTSGRSAGDDLNELVVLGNYSFAIDHFNAPLHIPDMITGEMDDNSEYSGNLMVGVTRYKNDNVDLFSHPWLYKKQKILGQSEVPMCAESVTQTMIATRVADTGSMDTDVFTRSGYSLDTACYLRTILNVLFSVTPQSLITDYKTVDALAELFSTSVGYDKGDSFIAGFYAPVKGAMVRTGDLATKTGTQYFKSNRKTGFGKHVFDWTSWLESYSMIAMSGNVDIYIDALDAFVSHSKPLTHLTYFAQAIDYTKASFDTAPSNTEDYYLQKNAGGYELLAGVDPYLLKDYFVTADAAPVAGKEYFVRRTDGGGSIFAKTELGAYIYDPHTGAFEDGVTYYEYGLIKSSVGSDGELRWGKRKLVPNEDRIYASETYYAYDEDSKIFNATRIPNDNFNDGDLFKTDVIKREFYVDYPIFTKTVARQQVAVEETVTPVTNTTDKFVHGQIYRYRAYAFTEVPIIFNEGEPNITPVESIQYFTKSGEKYTPCAMPLDKFVEGNNYFTRSNDYTESDCTEVSYTPVSDPDFSSDTEYYKYADGKYTRVYGPEAGVTEYYTCSVVQGEEDPNKFFVAGTTINAVAVPDGELAPYATVVEAIDHEFPDNNDDMSREIDNRLWMKQFFYKSVDTDVVEGKRYYKKIDGTDADFALVTLAAGSNPAASNCYEAFGVEDLYDCWCAVKDLTVNGFKLGSSEKFFKYEFGSDGTMLAWGDWRKELDSLDPFWIRLNSVIPEVLAKMTMSTDEKKVLFNGKELVFAEDISTQIGKAHTHSNKSVLDNLSYSEGHLKYSGAQIALVSELHSHSNKGVLDNMTQAVIDNSHTHTNKTVLDGITVALIGDWNGAVTDSHTHSNKAILDNVTQSLLDNSHTHSNSSILDDITSEKVDAWDDAAIQAHEHSNQEVLNGITSDKVSAWDAVAGKIVVCTQEEYDALEPDPDKLYFIHD